MGWNKYGARKVTIDGITFDSKLEAAYYVYLRDNETVSIIELQPKVYLTKARILYKPDFLVKDHEGFYYIDVKGMETAVFKIKKRLWRAYIDKPLHIIKKKGKSFKTSEVVNG